MYSITHVYFSVKYNIRDVKRRKCEKKYKESLKKQSFTYLNVIGWGHQLAVQEAGSGGQLEREKNMKTNKTSSSNVSFNMSYAKFNAYP